jgi:hypothetical protein
MVELGHDAAKAGMGIKEFTENAYAAKRSGVAIEDFTNSMSKLAKTAVAAGQGNAQAQRAFQLAGTSATDATHKLRPTGDILADIIKKFDSLTDKTLKAGLAQQLFGRGGASMLPFLTKGAAQIEEFKKQAEQLGVAFDENTLQAAKRFKGGINDFKAASEGATIQFTAGMLPALNSIFDSMTKVTGKASAMHDFGETLGEVFKGIASIVYKAAYAFEYWKIKYEEFKAPKLDDSAKNISSSVMGQSNPASGATALQQTGLLDAPEILTPEQRANFYKKNPSNKFQEMLDEANRKLQERLDGLDNPSSTKTTDGGKATGTNVSSPDKGNYAAEEIAKLREKAQSTLALAAAQLQSEASVRATTAANQADAIILQIATKASKEHKTALDAEIAAAQKKYGASVLTLSTLNDEATRSEALNKSIADSTREAGISADAHKRLADAISLGGSAVTEANVQNQIEAIIRKANTQLTDEQRQALDLLAQTRRNDADAAAKEGYATEVRTLTNAAEASRILSEVTGQGIEADIQARAAIAAKNYEIQHNITLTQQQRAELTKLYADQDRSQRTQSTASGLVSQYNPQANYKARIDEINLAVAQNKNLTVEAEAAKRDAYIQEQEEIDALAMKTQKGAAGATVALRQWVRESRNWAIQFHDSVNTVLQGFDSGFRNAFSDIIMGTKTVGQAFADMGKSMVQSVVNALAQIVAKWIETKVILAVLKLFGVNMSDDDPMAKAQKQIQANAATAQSYAGLAAAEEFAFALVESAGNVAYAFGMSMVALAIGEGYTALASFDNGGIMKQTGIALVHQDEGVLTAPVTKMLKTMATSPSFKNPSPRGGRAAAGERWRLPHYASRSRDRQPRSEGSP